MFGFNSNKVGRKKQVSPTTQSPGIAHPSSQPMILHKEPFKMSNPFQQQKDIAPEKDLGTHLKPPQKMAGNNPFFESSHALRPPPINTNVIDEIHPSKRSHFVDANSTKKTNAKEINVEQEVDDYDLLGLDILEMKSNSRNDAIKPFQECKLEVIQEEVCNGGNIVQEDMMEKSTMQSVPSSSSIKAYGIVFNEMEFMKRYTGEIEKINLHIKGSNFPFSNNVCPNFT